MNTLSPHSVPISLVSGDDADPRSGLHASATLLWIDRSFALTAAHVVLEFLRRQRLDPGARLWMGCLEIANLQDRILALSPQHDLASIRVEPSELDCLGDEASFHSPASWPPRPVEVGERVVVMGYPRDQWPALLSFTFQVQSATDRRFGAVLRKADMPGHLQGLSGAPAFRLGEAPELVGVVVDSLFHNEVVRAQHTRHVCACGMLPSGPDRA